jgi:hypothetical protein
MSLRFQDWTTVGTITFTPDDLSTVVGPFSLAENHDTIWVRITQLNGQVNSPWSYGILSWKSPNGFELGSIKAYGELESEVFRLGIGRPPYDRTGVLTFEPRSWNLGWIKNGYPWQLKFEASSGQTTNTGGGAIAGAAIGGFVDTADNGISLVRVNYS